MLMRCKCIVVLLVYSAMMASQTWALDFSEVLTEGTVGSGSNQAMVVVDWNSGLTPSHAWLFQWDGSAVVGDAYNAIQAAYAGTFSWSNSSFVTEMNYNDGIDNHVGNSQGWMSFWNSLDGESWFTNNNGIFDQLLTPDGWTGANAEGIVNNWPGPEPTVPTIPEPASAAMAIAGLTLIVRRRRDHTSRTTATKTRLANHRLMWIFGAVTTMLTAGTIARAASFADEVVSYDQGANPVAGFTNPSTAQGAPEAFTGEGIFPSVVSPFNPAFGTDEIVSIGTGGHITLRLSHYAIPQVGGPEIGVFTNVGFFDLSYPNGVATSPAGGFGDNYAIVEVSENGQSWVSLNSGNEIGFLLPTNGYTDLTNPYATTAGSVLADPSLPFTGTLSSFDGLPYSHATNPDMLELLNGSAGGTWLDISSTGLSQVGYIRFLVPNGITPGGNGDTNFELDAVSVAANAVGAMVPEPATLTLLALAAGFTLRRRGSR